jgi:hypothetical protein
MLVKPQLRVGIPNIYCFYFSVKLIFVTSLLIESSSHCFSLITEKYHSLLYISYLAKLYVILNNIIMNQVQQFLVSVFF